MGLGLLVAACGPSQPPSAAVVTASPTPLVTPNPHLTDPASAEVVFTAIARAGLPISANNAAAGTDPVKQINATYRDWPMLISEYRSKVTLGNAKPWKPGDLPGQGEPPVAIRGLNILIEWGPKTGPRPPKLDAGQVTAMNAFVKLVDIYLGPLTVRTSTELVVPAPPPTAVPTSSASAGASAAPSKKPKASP
jgi:hypothetical protein